MRQFGMSVTELVICGGSKFGSSGWNCCTKVGVDAPGLVN